MKMGDAENKTSKLPIFNGKEASYPMWEVKFNAYATINKFIQAVSEKPELDLPKDHTVVIDTSTDVGKRQAAAKKRNQEGYTALALAFNNDSILGLLLEAQTDEWPDGLACLVIKGLHDTYKLKD